MPKNKTNKISKFFNKKIRTLIFFVTSKCPLNCKHCFYNGELNKNIKELTLEEIEKIADNLPDLEYLELSGGEPFARQDIVELVEIFVKRGIKKAIIPTNGFLTNQIVSKVQIMKDKGFNFTILISIDGFEDLHNKIRGRNCFNQAIKTFDELKKIGVNPGFIVSLSKLNYDSYLDLLKYLKDKQPAGIDSVLVRAKPDIMLSYQQFKDIKSQIEEIIMRDMPLSDKKRKQILNQIYLDVLNGKKLPVKCLAGKIIAVLEPDGEVRICELRRKLGNVRDYNYDINKIVLLDKVPNDCGMCIHPCFIGPSMSYSLKWITKNIASQYV